MFLPIASNAGFAPAAGLVVAGVGRLGVGKAAFSLADRQQGRDPLSREIYNLKTDDVRGNVGRRNRGEESAAFHRDVDDYVSEFDERDRLFVAGLVLMVVSCLVTLELTGITVSFNSAPLNGVLPSHCHYPLLFGWVSYQTATKLAERKPQVQVVVAQPP
ncbi:hypothetical protein ACLB1E_30935 [Escherichia coli]